MAEIQPPDGWTKLDPDDYTRENGNPFYHFRGLLQRRRDGLVLAVEKGTGGRNRGAFMVVALPENFPDDDRPIRRYGDNGVIWDGDSLDEAIDAAENWAEDNPRN
jgi:hypothetical protein